MDNKTSRHEKVKNETIKYANECGVNLRKEDFKGNDIFIIWNNDTATVPIPFRIGGRKWRLTNELEKNKKNFLQYPFCSIDTEYITFTFSPELLENIQEGRDDVKKIIEKVTKLLALADPKNNPSEGEAIAASVKAQKLLAKYNLTMTDVTGGKKQEKIEELSVSVAKGKIWQRILGSIVANSYSCISCYTSNAVFFYGHKTDALLARRIFVYLFEVGDKLGKAEVKNIEQQYGIRTNVYNSFISGFLNGVSEELAKTARALTLVIPDDVKDTFEKEYSNIKKNKIRLHPSVAKSYDRGRIEGRRALTSSYLQNDSHELEGEF